MRMRPMDKRALIHKIEWRASSLLGSNTPYILEKVRIDPGYVYFPTGDQQSSYGNFKMYYDATYSTKPEGQIPAFAIGDTIKMIDGPINNYPKELKIINVWQFYDLDGKHIHHIEVLLR